MRDKSKKSFRQNWPVIVGCSIGGVLILYSLVVGSLNLLALGVMLVAGISARDLFFGPNPRQMEREARKRAAELLGKPAESDIPPEDFLRELGEKNSP
jgi:hypothetical protein